MLHNLYIVVYLFQIQLILQPKKISVKLRRSFFMQGVRLLEFAKSEIRRVE